MAVKSLGIETNDAVSSKTRLLAISAGCFSALAGTLSLGPVFLLVPRFLILGAIVQPRSPRLGRWLMWVGAFCLSLAVIPTGLGVLGDSMRAFHSHAPEFMAAPFALSLLSVVLVVWCDAALIVDAVMLWRRKAELQGPSQHSLDWLVWTAAVVLSAYCFGTGPLNVRAYRLHDRLDILLTWVVLSAVVLLFDVALVVHAVKSRAR
jgi:hypothetical protein